MTDKVTKIGRIERLAHRISMCCQIAPELHERVYQYDDNLFWLKCPACGLEGDNAESKYHAYMNWIVKVATNELQTKLTEQNKLLEVMAEALKSCRWFRDDDGCDWRIYDDEKVSNSLAQYQSYKEGRK